VAEERLRRARPRRMHAPVGSRRWGVGRELTPALLAGSRTSTPAIYGRRNVRGNW
jgi:hypothetical protein